jgi:uncharacterized repeat protein (TIGR03803 family)
MDSQRVFSLSAASGLACVRLASVLALQSALLTLCAQSPVIYSFGGPTGDGANPHCAPLIDSSGRLFGTTVYGGTDNDGVFYKLTPGTPWTETILHNFAGAPSDGSAPDGDLLLAGGNIYGTASAGGAHSAGNVFEMKNSSGTWTESILYNFAGGTGDGGGPYSGVILSGGVLYGTTFLGGSNLDGTAYSLTPPTPWAEAVLYNFGASSSDGVNPHSALLDAGSGVYYGTTYYGGSDSSGTVYQLTYSGKLVVGDADIHLYRRQRRVESPFRRDYGQQRRTLRHHRLRRSKQQGHGIQADARHALDRDRLVQLRRQFQRRRDSAGGRGVRQHPEFVSA